MLFHRKRGPPDGPGDPEVDLVGPEMNWMAHQWRCALRSEVDGCIYAVPCNASRWGMWMGKWMGRFDED